MTDKQLGITVTGDIEDILSKLDEVTGKIQDVPDRTIDLSVNANYVELDNLNSYLDQITDKNIAVNVDDSGLSQLAIAADDVSNSVQAIGDSAIYASSDINSSIGASSPAESSLVSLSSNANAASNEITGTGTSATEAGNEITGSMSDAALTIAAVGAAAELAAQQIYGMSQNIEQLSNYTGLTTDELKKMETSLSSASFPISDINTYITALSQLGVSSDLLEKNAAAMNEIAEGTGASSSAVSQFTKDIKALGGDVSNLSDYYGLAGYAQANVVGGLEGFASYAKILGPKLTEMGLSAEESTVVIGALSQKYAGNMRGMRSAVTAADGDVNKLYSSLGLTQSSVDSSAGSFDSYSGKLTDTAASARNAHSGLEETYVSAQDLGIMLGFTGADLLSFTEIVAVAVGGPYLLAKALDKLGLTANWSGRYIQFLKSSVGSIWDVFKSVGTSILNTIRSWMGWGDEAGKASENVASKMLEKSGSVGDAGETVGRAAGEGFSKGESEAATLIDDAGNVIWTDTESVVTNLGTVAPKAEEAGSLIPESLGIGLLKSSPRLLGRVADILVILQLGIEGIYNYNDYLKENPIELGLDFYLGPWTDLIPQQIKDFNQQIFGWLSPINLAKSLFGGANVDSFVGMMNTNIVNPVKGGLDSLWGVIKSPPKLAAIPGEIYNSLSGVPGSISGALANAPAAFDNFTNKLSYGIGFAIGTIIKFPGRAYAALLPTGQNMYNALINAPAYLRGAWTNTAAWFTALPGNLYLYGVNAWNGLTNGFNAAYAGVVGAVNNIPAAINGTIAWIGGLPGTLYQYGANAWNGLAGGFNSSVGNVQGSVNSLTGSIQSGINWIINLPGNMYNWGKNIIDSFVKGLNDSLTGAKSWIEAKLGWLFRGFAAASPPLEGPLSTIDIWGESIGSTFAEGVASGLSASKGLLSSSLGTNIDFNSMATSTQLPSAASLQQNNGGATINFTGPITIPKDSDALEVGRDLGKGAHEGWTSKVVDQAGRAGLSIPNQIR